MRLKQTKKKKTITQNNINTILLVNTYDEYQIYCMSVLIKTSYI